jgi:hypothetical protein
MDFPTALLFLLVAASCYSAWLTPIVFCARPLPALRRSFRSGSPTALECGLAGHMAKAAVRRFVVC